MAKVIFEKKNILITGGAGFLGSHLCEELVKENKVICLDNFITSERQNIERLLGNPDFAFINHDINQPFEPENFSELKKFRIEFQGIQEIYNLACPTSPKQFDDLKIQTIKTNTIGLINMLELAEKYKAKFLQASSAVVYGKNEDDEKVYNEKEIGLMDQLNPRASYDLGKKYAETIVKDYKERRKLDARIARVFRSYGPRMALNQGEMIPDFIVNALEDKPLVIYGDEDFSTSLCYASDMVEGLIKLMNSKKDLGPVNLGGEQRLKLYDVASKIIELTESNSQIVFEPALIFMTGLVLPDISKAKKNLDWLPIVGLESGLKMTIDFTKARKVLKGM